MSDRAIDANGNRAVEGLRVLEDVARFRLDADDLARRLKDWRHQLRQAIPARVLASRDTAGDVGTRITAGDEMRRPDERALVRANAARVAEALRVIEEFAKLDDATLAATAEGIRYGLYDCEAALCARLPASRLRREPLYALIDTALTDAPVAVAAAVVAGGAGIVQLRAKELSAAAYATVAAEMQAVVRAAGGLFIVNDHVAIAAAIAADGIHVGQDDLPVALVRRAVPAGCLIGCSCHSPEQIAAACAAGADYLGVGPMFATATKAHEPARGPALLDAVQDCPLPTYAIGGLDAERIAALRPRLPHGVAVAGALCRAGDPTAAARAIRALFADAAEDERTTGR